MLYHQPAGFAAFSASLPGDDQHHPEPARWRAHPDPPRYHRQNGKLVLRWMASAFLRTEKHFNKIMGYRDLWALETVLDPSATASQKAG